MSDPGSLAWVDGEIVSRSSPQVSIDDIGFRYGLTCFETMLARHGRVFRLAQHIERLSESLRLFRSELPAARVLDRAIAETLAANDLTDAAVRLSISPGVGTRPALPASGPARIIVTADPIGDGHPRGRLWTCESVRLDSTRPWRGAKVGQFAPYLLARLEAEEQGAEDGLLLNEQGHLVEASTANFFLVMQDGLVTPPLDDGPLPGVTRACVIELASIAGIPIREISVTTATLHDARAAFLTSSVAGLATVESIAWRSPTGRREWRPADAPPWVDALRSAYERLVEDETVGSRS